MNIICNGIQYKNFPKKRVIIVDTTIIDNVHNHIIMNNGHRQTTIPISTFSRRQARDFGSNPYLPAVS
ncbi:hypothetical protein BLA29_002335 [Euroglyphus maynei]|uniref:Uncharacterized protein n=1 Tax=Euroglyphus maynei TaxID=6958 RepID=A0A1Y3BJ01_EURMA|nr:hypothetical protein BLA29_002335 [Euroglyphus maynei]